MKVSRATARKFDLLAAIDHVVEIAIKQEASVEYIKKIAKLRSDVSVDAWAAVNKEHPGTSGKDCRYNRVERTVELINV